MKMIAIVILRLFKYTVSPMLPPACRFTPTCSEYSLESISKYGFWKGSALSLKRLLRCHPFCAGGYDPVR
jgi:putative membrane protein insertion efficiency factor